MNFQLREQNIWQTESNPFEKPSTPVTAPQTMALTAEELCNYNH